MSQRGTDFVERFTVEDKAPRKRRARSASTGRPFWITLAVAALLAGAFGLSRYEAPPEKPARVVLQVEGLH